jgi:hypothetical protein
MYPLVAPSARGGGQPAPPAFHRRGWVHRIRRCSVRDTWWTKHGTVPGWPARPLRDGGTRGGCVGHHRLHCSGRHNHTSCARRAKRAAGEQGGTCEVLPGVCMLTLRVTVYSFCCYCLFRIPSGLLVVLEKPTRSASTFTFAFTFTCTFAFTCTFT